MCIRDSYRRLTAKGGVRGPVQLGLSSVENLPESVTALSAKIMKRESIRQLFGTLDGLDLSDRRLVMMCGLEELPFADVAKLMNLSRDAVAKRWQRLRARLIEESPELQMF